MFRLLPWPSAIGGDKVMEEVKMLAPSNCAPGVNSLPLPRLKRKRSDSDATDTPAATRMCTEKTNSLSPTVPTVPNPPQQSATSPAASSPTVATVHSPAQVATGGPDVTRLRETITAQLSLEVLLKHNELRLIDQEIAKCQVALEQVRRCAEIPYPGSIATGISSAVSMGSGAALLPGNGPAPLSPAPWGVTEGPYSRHYARWLLPDPRFDGGEVDPALAATAGTGAPLVEGRSTRGNPVDLGSLAGKTRPSRGSTGAKLQALPNGYPMIKEKAGPMLIRRKSDQVLVKLVCLDCRRDNFSSTQGFINHCRIAHNRNFASHDAAAMASGEPVEVDEAGAVVGGQSESNSSTPGPAYVHPLIRSAHLPTPSKDTTTPRKSSMNSSAKPPIAIPTPPATAACEPRRQSEPVKLPTNPSFLASPATPHLSALMRQRGAGLDMGKLVQEAKTPVDLSALSDEEDVDMDESGPLTESSQEPQLGVRASRQPMRMPVAPATSERPESRKGLERAAEPLSLEAITPSRPPSHPQPLLSGISFPGPSTGVAETPREDGMEHPNLSPHTIESNQAPSLVSDDEDDYEAASESDSPSSSEADDQDEEFRHIQVEDDERTAAPSTATTEAKSGPSLAAPAPQSAPTLSQPLKRSRSNKMSSMVPPFSDHGNEDTRVNFGHPAENPAKSQRAPGRKPAPSNP
ncbi:hypothetical protein NUU61_007698 [Penicillium alfredii]|uniref:AHC1-like C2H2 zinc-finger domain-containing protein n=1 Tax=Penicillium alfredii TaxID=1506179 RepID=A0A9W9ER40_9EURO|nr:uncharacterized protein NUU61_007698 [Penicillium alfredii]KAJ5086391.1 hypothetical protein NUU61_007698 [Penicillium alfredii]